MTRTLAPSGSPIYIRELLACLKLQSIDTTLDQLRTAICRQLNVNHAFFLANGRGAMTLLLSQLAQMPNPYGKTNVVLPTYTCYSVAASVLKAGLGIIACDIDSETLTYDRDQLESIDFSSVLAIVSANLYGLPDDLDWLESFAKSRDAHLIDDAAQCLGAMVDGRPVGSFGTAGILSLDKGKVITSINGGVIVTNDDGLADRIRCAYSNIPDQPLAQRGFEFLKAIVYALFLHPRAYWLPSSIPLLGLGQTRYDDKFPIERYSSRLAPIASRQLSRLNDLNRRRVCRAKEYLANLKGLDRLAPIRSVTNSAPIYLRFPILVQSSVVRSQICDTLARSGISTSYPASIAQIPEIQGATLVHNGRSEGGELVARQILTLPTHDYVGRKDLDRICDTIRQTVDN